LNVTVAGVHFPVTALGPGTRIGIWFQGCSIHCPGCMARDTWDPAGGISLSFDDLTDRLQSFPTGEVTGITISGGEPFDQPEALLRLVEWLRGSYCRADQDVLLYSGYSTTLLHSEHPAVLAAVDALISEPLDGGVSPSEPLRWRGSTNQILTPLSALGRERYAFYASAKSRFRIDASIPGVTDPGYSTDAQPVAGVCNPGGLRKSKTGLTEASSKNKTLWPTSKI